MGGYETLGLHEEEMMAGWSLEASAGGRRKGSGLEHGEMQASSDGP